MANRKRNIQMKFYVTEDENRLIDEKMSQLPTRRYGAYLRKMAIDGYNRKGHSLRPHKGVGENVKRGRCGHAQLAANRSHLCLYLRIHPERHIRIHNIRLLARLL